MEIKLTFLLDNGVDNDWDGAKAPRKRGQAFSRMNWNQIEIKTQFSISHNRFSIASLPSKFQYHDNNWFWLASPLLPDLSKVFDRGEECNETHLLHIYFRFLSPLFSRPKSFSCEHFSTDRTIQFYWINNAAAAKNTIYFALHRAKMTKWFASERAVARAETANSLGEAVRKVLHFLPILKWYWKTLSGFIGLNWA